MNKQLRIWKLIRESLASDTPVKLLYVLESKGSSPGRQGFFMAVNANGMMEGSIGGGIMEHKFVEMAKQFQVNSPKSVVQKQVHDKKASNNQSGMICSGEQTIWIYEIKEKDKITIERIITSLEQNKNGRLMLSANGIKFSEEEPSQNFYFEFHDERNWQYSEKTGYKNRLFIIGGGHCSLALSRLMSQMDYYISVYDDRKNLSTMLANVFAHEKHIVKDFSELGFLVPAGKNHYVVIMTFGYRTDDMALRAIFNKEFAYTGVLGSAAKMKKLFAEYRKEGFDELKLNRIHTPVGLPIRSQTPEEIAISIAAQIIKEKNSL